jgi:hypothetical protein
VFGSGYSIHSFRLTFIQKIKFWKQPEHKKWGHGSIKKINREIGGGWGSE